MLAKIRSLIDRITTPQPQHMLLLTAFIAISLNAAQTQELASAAQVAELLALPYIFHRQPR